MFKTESHEIHFENVLFFLHFCVYIYLFYTFSVLQEKGAIFLIIWSIYLHQDALNMCCMDITYNLCASFWVQILHSLLLNSRQLNKYFVIVYNNFHILIALTFTC